MIDDKKLKPIATLMLAGSVPLLAFWAFAAEVVASSRPLFKDGGTLLALLAIAGYAMFMVLAPSLVWLDTLVKRQPLMLTPQLKLRATLAGMLLLLPPAFFLLMR